MTGVLTKRGNLNIEANIHMGRIACDREGGHQGDMSPSPGRPKISGAPLEAG